MKRTWAGKKRHITVHTISYTNHTTLSEALEKWPIHLFKPLLPRMYMIIEEINERFCRAVWEKVSGRLEKDREHGDYSAWCCQNGSSGHSRQLQCKWRCKNTFRYIKGKGDARLSLAVSNRFNNKTNGIAHRRWLLKANPGLSAIITEAIGDEWVKQPESLIRLEPYATDPAFIEQFQNNKSKKNKSLPI